MRASHPPLIHLRPPAERVGGDLPAESLGAGSARPHGWRHGAAKPRAGAGRPCMNWRAIRQYSSYHPIRAICAQRANSISRAPFGFTPCHRALWRRARCTSCCSRAAPSRTEAAMIGPIDLSSLPPSLGQCCCPTLVNFSFPSCTLAHPVWRSHFLSGFYMRPSLSSFVNV